MVSSPLGKAVLRTKALAHPIRLRLLALLREGELCVCQMTALLRLAPSTVSAHLAGLKRAGLLSETKSGKWVLYRLADGVERDSTVAPLLRSLDDDDRVRADAALMQQLRAIPRETLCAADLDLERLGLPVLPRPAPAAPPPVGRRRGA
jgi:DNA-binding transcriptional ArsR family regulator